MSVENPSRAGAWPLWSGLEVFERAFRAVSEGRGPKPGLWEPWLLLTTRRLVISHHRHHGFLRLLPLGGDNGIDAGDSACFDEAELNLWLDQITRLLPARQREALFLRYLGDLDDTAVGAVLGIGPSGVRSLVSRAMANLREHEELWR